MFFTGAKSSPYILLLLIDKKCLARMETSLLMQCIITEKQYLIKLTRYDETKNVVRDSQIVRDNENLKLSYGGPSQGQASGTNQRI